MLIGYARVSTNDKETPTKVVALKTAGRDRIYHEKLPGGGRSGLNLTGTAGDFAPGTSVTVPIMAANPNSYPVSIAITSDQGALAYEVGDSASVTISASDATSGLASDPSVSHLPLSTVKPWVMTCR